MKCFIVLIISCLSCIVYGKDSTKVVRTLGLELGLQSVFVKDLYRSPYLYRGFNTDIALRFERISRRGIHGLYANYHFGPLRTGFSPRAPQHGGRLAYIYARNVLAKKGCRLDLGPDIHAQAWRMDYFPDMDVPYYAKMQSYLVTLGLGLNAQVRYQCNTQSSLLLSVTQPLFNYVERPQFMDGRATNGFGAFNLWNPQVKLTYMHTCGSKMYLTLGYRYVYLQYQQPKTLRMLQNGLSVGIGF